METERQWYGPVLQPAKPLLTGQDFEQLARMACYRTGRLAKLTGMSIRTLERRFFEQNGSTPSQWLDSLRFKAARSLLSCGKSVKEVAAETGYTDSSHFSTAFKKHFGCGPRKFIAAAKPPESVSIWLD